jgi:predicted signal transduction protein with EAL and GGDEF domain
LSEADLALARFGGDEFALIVFDEDPPSVVRDLAVRLLDLMSTPVEVDGVAITVRASIGIVCAPEDASDADSLLSRVDSAMYRAKQVGNTFGRYVAGDERGAARRLSLAGQLPAALASEQIEVHYQPTVELDTGRCNVLEALVRWRHPDYGLVPPAEFVPLAEQYGLGIPLVKRVMADALAQCAHWRAEDLARSVAVNVAPATLVDPRFISCVVKALAAANVPAEALVLELTENAFAGDLPAVRDALVQLGAIGIKVAIDDFGTGYSSLAHLERFPVHAVKLDRAFTVGLGSDSANDAIMSLTARLGRQLGLTVIAEGVETLSELEAAARHGCDVAQGFWICAPSPADTILTWLANYAHEWGQTTEAAS